MHGSELEELQESLSGVGRRWGLSVYCTSFFRKKSRDAWFSLYLGGRRVEQWHVSKLDMTLVSARFPARYQGPSINTTAACPICKSDLQQAAFVLH